MASTTIHFECQSPAHVRAGSRRGVGGLVIHHGSVGYCHGVNADGVHRWVATGGVPIEDLFKATAGIDGPGTYRAREGTLVHVRPSAAGKLVVEVDSEARADAGDLHLGVKLSDDPDWPDVAPAGMAFLPAD